MDEEYPLGKPFPGSPRIWTIGAEVSFEIAAPGSGHVTYQITRQDENGEFWGRIVRNNSHMLEPWEVE